MNILNYLTKEELQKVKSIDFQKGQILYFEDEECKEIGVICYGEIEIATILSNGEKVIYTHLKKDDTFGSNLLFSSNPRFKGNVTALTDGKVYLISEQLLKTFLVNNDIFLVQYLKAQGEFAMKLNQRIKLLSMPSAKDRIMFVLENSISKSVHVKTVTGFAEKLGLTREATSRTIAKLVDEGYITFNNKVITKK